MQLALFCFMILLSILERFDEIDKWLFLLINTRLTNTFFDAVMPFLRESDIWIPFYLFLFVFVTYNFGLKAWPWIFFLAITVIISDQISSSFLKDFFNRTRPCRNEELTGIMRLLVVYCPKSGSFTSSHAANHFAIAWFLFHTLRSYLHKYVWLFFIWGGLIAYAQVYVGVHYPFDVIGGAALGCLIGAVTSKVYLKWLGLPPLESTQ